MGGVLVNNLPMPAQTVIFVNHNYNQNTKYILPENLEKINFLKNDQIIPINKDINIFEKLKLKYPNGEIIKKEEFDVFVVK